MLLKSFWMCDWRTTKLMTLLCMGCKYSTPCHSRTWFKLGCIIKEGKIATIIPANAFRTLLLHFTSSFIYKACVAKRNTTPIIFCRFIPDRNVQFMSYIIHSSGEKWYLPVYEGYKTWLKQLDGWNDGYKRIYLSPGSKLAF